MSKLDAINFGDCLPWLKAMPSCSVDALVTDIPYGISQDSAGLRNLNYGTWDATGDVQEHISEALRVSRGAAFVFCDGRQLSWVLNLLERDGMTVRQFAWHKPNPSPMNGNHVLLSAVELAAWGKRPLAYFGGHCEHNFWEGTAPSHSSRIHPTQKPLDLVEHIVRLCCPEGGTVLDPFAGSGTTAVACIRSGRHFIAAENDQENFEAAKAWIGRERRAQLSQFDLQEAPK